jgi:hypothetical protein
MACMRNDEIEARLSRLEEMMEHLRKGLEQLANELEQGQRIQPGLRGRMRLHQLRES